MFFDSLDFFERSVQKVYVCNWYLLYTVDCVDA
jgi:hypothetical protein